MDIAGLCLPLKPQKERRLRVVKKLPDGFFGCNMISALSCIHTSNANNQNLIATNGNAWSNLSQ